LNDLVSSSTNSFARSASHLDKGHEIFGQVDGIQPVDDETIRVQIGQTAVLLPAKLKLSVGRRVFMARIDTSEYVAWVVPEEEHVPPAQPICQAGFTLDEICREIESGNLISFLKNRLGDRVDLSHLNFSILTAADAERLQKLGHSAPVGCEPLTQGVLEHTHKVRGKSAAAKPQARAKAGVRRVRA